jgi:hypothetical protein
MTSTMRFDKWENSLGQPYGTVLQVVSASKTDTFTTSSSTYGDIDGLSVSITPSSASSKIMVFANAFVGSTVNAGFQLKLVRGVTDIFIGDAAGSRTRGSKSAYTTDILETDLSLQFLDSPATVSAVTYKLQGRASTNNPVFLNRNSIDSDSSGFARGASSITLMEIAQ